MNRVSWFNLHVLLPIKDLRKIIYRKLGYGEYVIARMVHNIQTPFCSNSFIFAQYCACRGYVELLDWAVKNGCRWNEYVPASACEGGQLEMLKWLYTTNCPIDVGFNYASALRKGQIPIIEWLVSKGRPKELNMTVAIRQGRVQMLQWLYENEFLTQANHSRYLATAVRRDLVDVVKWMVSVFQPKARLLELAKKGGNQEIIRLIMNRTS